MSKAKDIPRPRKAIATAGTVLTTGTAESGPLRINRYFDSVSERLSNPDCILFDRYAIWFYAICIAIFAFMCAARLNGSSIAIFSSGYHYGAPGAAPIVGVPSPIRVDEWNSHTPLILNQYLRPDRFSPEKTIAGPGKAGLIANAPMRHFTTIFRPEFWSFFVLPFDYAYSIYWEAKWLILVTGLFTLLLLLTRSSVISAIGALWFLFSGSTQWQLSWQSLLPDMVGLSCWIVCLFCYLLVSKDVKRSAVAGLCLVGCTVDFAMCSYIPHQIPLVWFAVTMIAVFVSTRLQVIWDPRFRRMRTTVLLAALSGLGMVMLLLYRDIAPTIAAVAQTSYPGHRAMAGGAYNLISLGSDLFDFWKSENYLPRPLGNICEGTGFLWLAPVTLFCFSKLSPLSRRDIVAFCGAGLLFVSLWCWEVLPIPATAAVARYTFFDRVGLRALPALGLVNIVLVTLVLSWRRLPRKNPLTHHLLEVAGIFSVALAVLGLVNLGLNSFYSLAVLLCAASVTTLAVKSLLEGWRRAFGLVVIVPGLVAFAWANPLQRGMDPVFESQLYHTVRQNPALRHGRWLAFSANPAVSGFLGSVGCDVYTGLKFVPDTKGLDLFDPTGEGRTSFNQSGYLLAVPAPEGSPSSFQTQSTGIVLWHVSPLDRRLKTLGIQYAAFDGEPPPAIRNALSPVAPNPVSGLWLYKLP
jgi:hypothetical protein